MSQIKVDMYMTEHKCHTFFVNCIIKLGYWWAVMFSFVMDLSFAGLSA